MPGAAAITFISSTCPPASWQGRFQLLPPLLKVPLAPAASSSLGVAGFRAFQNALATKAPLTCGISVTVSGIISWTVSVFIQEH